MQLINYIAKSISCISKQIDCIPMTTQEDSVMVKYRLSIPNWVENKDVVKDGTQYVLYTANRKHRIAPYIVWHHEINQNLPSHISNNKMLVNTVVYTVDELLKKPSIVTFINKEHDRLFREIRANITLQKIGNLTAKWNAITDGVHYHDQHSTDNYIKLKHKNHDRLPF